MVHQSLETVVMGLQKVNGCCIANSMDGQCVISPTEKEDPCKEMIEVMDALVAAEKKYKSFSKFLIWRANKSPAQKPADAN